MTLASPAAAIAAANALCPDLNGPFNNFTVVQVAATAQGSFVNCIFDGKRDRCCTSGQPRRGMMTNRIGAQELLDGYEILFDAAQACPWAVMVATAELSDDGWPTVPMLIRFAKC